MSVVAIESFQPLRNEPTDFDRFWSSTRENTLEVEPKPQLSLEKRPLESLSYQKLSFTSLGHVPVAGYLLAHERAEPRPLIVHTHGYNAQYDVMLHWASRGCHVLGIDTRGFGRSAGPKLDPGGYLLTGVATPQSSILRGAVADVLQAVRVGRMILGWRMSMLTMYGFSFGGAMALMASTLETQPDLLVMGQPTFGWHEERLRLATAGSAAELRDRVARNTEQRDTILQTLNYFDSLHFAARTTAPTILGIGLDDEVVPSRTVMAIASELNATRREIRYLPVAHSSDPRESLWSDFDDEWLALSRTGPPADFGSKERETSTLERAAS